MGVERKSLRLVKGLMGLVGITLRDDRPRGFLLDQEQGEGACCHHSSLRVPEDLAVEGRQEKGVRGIHLGKEGAKLPLFTDHTILNIDCPT